jgi:predicted aspartyl protease
VRIEGIITQSGEMQIDGYICKDDLKMATSFKLDTGFIGYDVAIPADIAQKLSLRPSRDEEFITAAGRFRFSVGDDAYLCLGGNMYKVSYMIYYNPFTLISITFLRRISEIIIIDFINNNIIIVLK